MTDEKLIRRTLKLAEKGRGRVSPNPMVGALLVQNGAIVGEGYHQVFGGEHAETVVLNSVRNGQAVGSVLYVNLEPCSHQGKQPPCVDGILSSGIRKVVVGTKDPNPAVNGNGIKRLRANGVEVRTGVSEDKCRQLNEAYFKHVKTGQPLTTVKIAQTLDGRIAATGGDSKWITSEKSRRLGHKLRSQHDAVLVGIGTVLADNPSLTVRLVRGVNPKRVVLDSRLRISLKSNLLSDSCPDRTIVVTTASAPARKVREIESAGAAVWKLRADSAGRVDLAALWKELGSKGVTSLLVEGGAEIFSAVLRSKLADNVFVFVAPKILGSGVNALLDLGITTLADCIQFRKLQKRQVGSDLLFHGSLTLN